MTNKTNTEEENIIKHYGWFKEGCKKRKIKPINYKQYKKEFIEMQELNKTPQEQERLKGLSLGLKKAMELLK